MEKTSSSKSPLPVQIVVLSEVIWAVAALLFFLLFSVTVPGQERPTWYSVGTSIFEAIAYLVAAFLCFRNWRSPQIVSGRNVWLGIGLGMFCYFLGNLIFSYWEIALALEPTVSPADLFFVLTYAFLIWGMILAVANKRLNLEIWQWGVVAGIAALGLIIAVWISTPSEAASSFLEQPAVAQSAPVTPVPQRSTPAPQQQTKPRTQPTTRPRAITSPAASPKAVKTPAPKAKSPTAPVGPKKPAVIAEPKSTAPAWAVSLEKQLAPLEAPVNWFYVLSDLALLIIATMLLLAFWGGRFAQSWRMIAAAAFCLYIADMWFKYATNPAVSSITDYQSGGLLEVFWVFSGVLFGIGAALEYDLSSRSRSRAGGRRRVSS